MRVRLSLSKNVMERGEVIGIIDDTRDVGSKRSVVCNRLDIRKEG